MPRVCCRALNMMLLAVNTATLNIQILNVKAICGGQFSQTIAEIINGVVINRTDRHAMTAGKKSGKQQRQGKKRPEHGVTFTTPGELPAGSADSGTSIGSRGYSGYRQRIEAAPAGSISAAPCTAAGNSSPLLREIFRQILPFQQRMGVNPVSESPAWGFLQVD